MWHLINWGFFILVVYMYSLLQTELTVLWCTFHYNINVLIFSSPELSGPAVDGSSTFSNIFSKLFS